MDMNSTTVEMSLRLSPETNQKLEKLCDDNQLTTSELLSKSLALIEVALKYKKNGNHLIVVDNKDHKISEIVGL